MYIDYLDDRKSLGYPALKDTRCGIKLVFINDPMKSESKRIMVVICLEMLLIFGNVEPAGAKDNWGVEGFTAPISPSQSSRGYFESRPARGASGQNRVVVEEIKTQVPELLIVHQIQLQKLHLK